MEARKASLSSIKLCRFCLSQSDSLTNIYEKYRAPKNSVTLPLKILSCISIEVFPSDKMPIYICNRCKFFMEISYEFKHICRQADEHILQYIQNATPLSPLTWSQSLLKVFRMANKSSEVAVMKTIVEGGATVHVTAQDSDTDEEDDEHVYNVKIGDGSEELKSARVKVITSPEKADKGKGKRGKDMKKSNKTETENKQDTTSVVREGCWPCDECENTYPLQQLLELHKAQKHRERNVSCPECDAKFFTTHDMMTHQLTHSNELNFECIACDKKFKRLIPLKRHEKIAHSDLPQHVCKYCPATYLSAEELKYHQKRHAHLDEKRFDCTICDKRFHEKSSLQRHIENMHNPDPPYACEYCPSRFTSVSKLSRHVRAHAGDRSYPCKYCNKSFTKSHHYTRHLRLKHRETIRTCRGPFGETDQYRCEQCEDSFATQDELIYHSAIHATQNLICPLCQEKFDDVDAVTAHIKSHVNGTEFMCDLCELVFTSQEKLDNHITTAHDDEIRNVPDLAQDESSMEMDVDEEEEDSEIQVKEEGDDMVVEIKKADEFMLANAQGEAEDKLDNTNSEESEPEMSCTEHAAVTALTEPTKIPERATLVKMPTQVLGGVTITKNTTVAPKSSERLDNQQTASILRKAEEIKKKVVQQVAAEPDKKDKNGKNNNKSENSNTVGASDKSLRLLEKELQELKRTNTRSEVVKTPAKPLDTLRSRRALIHTSTPKIRTPTVVEEKKIPAAAKSPAVEKKVPERRVVTKENKEPKEIKDTKPNNVSTKDEKETPKNAVKNGNSDRSNSEDGVRRSTRPSKIRDYAKMIRDRAQDSDENDDSDDTDDEEYKETEKSIESRPKARRASIKVTPKPSPVPTPPAATPARKRGRPRKDATTAKIRKEDEDDDVTVTTETEKEGKPKTPEEKEKETDKNSSETTESNKTATEQKPASDVLVSPTGQTLKKIPIKALPPGVKPLPLPVNARPMGGGEVCEMQIGKKVVKVQKIVMTKAEVEAMAKKGLVEMKDGTMVLKQGIKIPTADPTSLKTSLVGEDAGKESPSKKATPSRCDFGDDS